MPPRTPTHTDDDLSLMQRVAAGEEQAVEQLYDRFGSLVYKMAAESMPSRAEAEDAVQEIFVRLWRTAERYDPKRAALVTWVMLISRRHLVDKLRRKRARVKASSMGDLVAADPRTEGLSHAGADVLGDRERFGVLMDRVETLPELQRTVVIRAYLYGQTLRQIGEELDTPLGTIKSALSRALVRLRERSAEDPAR